MKYQKERCPLKKQKYKFPEPSCRSCPHHQELGTIFNPTRYCGGFKRKKLKRFRRSEPAIKIPRWCPKRLSPMVCRIYGFADEQSEYMEKLSIANFDPNEPYIYPIGSHYTLRREMSVSMNARQFFQAAQEEPLEELLSDLDMDFGEVVEIDDGLCPCYFYYFGFLKLIPIPIFHPPGKDIKTKEVH